MPSRSPPPARPGVPDFTDEADAEGGTGRRVHLDNKPPTDQAVVGPAEHLDAGADCRDVDDHTFGPTLLGVTLEAAFSDPAGRLARDSASVLLHFLSDLSRLPRTTG